MRARGGGVAASDSEITRRIGLTREGMKVAGFQALIIFSQVILGEKAAVRYLSNYRLLTRKDYMVLPLSGDAMMVVPTTGQQRAAAAASWMDDVRCGDGTEGMIREVAEKLKSSGLERAKIGVVGLLGSVPHYDFELLRGALPQASFTDATAFLDGIRMTKSPEEIEMTRATSEIADRCYEKVVEVMRPGIDEREVMAEVHKLMTLEGVEDNLILTSKGRSFPCFISPPGPYRFNEGDHYVFSIEISGPSGYWSQVVRPMCLGTPSRAYERLFEVGKKALDAGIARLKPGERAGVVAKAVADEVRKEGFATGVWCGHAMGMDLGDGLGLSEDNPVELREGAVITLHPHIISSDGKEGLLMGDTYAVREGGGENLSRTVCEMKRL